MSADPQVLNSGMELRDLLEDVAFANRTRSVWSRDRDIQALQRLARVFAETPEAILQQLVDLAVESCGADSAGISLEETTESGEKVFRWVAISGSFAQHLHGTTPRFFSPCGTCLDSGRPQLYRVTQAYYDFLGVAADEITDGMLIPWINEVLRGTIWAVSHHSRETFHREDYELLSTLADFASMALRHQHQQDILRQCEREAASAARANELAHLVNNPLQSLTNTIYLAQQDTEQVPQLLEQAMDEIARLSDLVQKLLDRKRHDIKSAVAYERYEQ